MCRLNHAWPSAFRAEPRIGLQRHGQEPACRPPALPKHTRRERWPKAATAAELGAGVGADRPRRDGRQDRARTMTPRCRRSAPTRKRAVRRPDLRISRARPRRSRRAWRPPMAKRHALAPPSARALAGGEPAAHRHRRLADRGSAFGSRGRLHRFASAPLAARSRYLRVICGSCSHTQSAMSCSWRMMRSQVRAISGSRATSAAAISER